MVETGLRPGQAVERWLVEEVATTYDAMMADPDNVLSLEEVHASILAHHAARTAE